MGFRTGLLIGALAMAVVALGVAVFLLAGDDESQTPTTAEAETAVAAESCEFESMGGEVEIDFETDIGCAEARGIYEAFREVGTFSEPTEVDGWTCGEFPFAEYPLMTRCVKGAEKFEILGLAPHAHVDEAPPPTPDTSLGWETCSPPPETFYYRVRVYGTDCEVATEVLTESECLEQRCGRLAFVDWRCTVGSSIADRATVCRWGSRQIIARASGD